MRLFGFAVNMQLIKFFASGVTVSHSGDGYWNHINVGYLCTPNDTTNQTVKMFFLLKGLKVIYDVYALHNV